MQEIDVALERLNEIVALATKTKQKYGYFAAMHRRMTYRVKQGIVAGLFENGELMARLEGCLAGHYVRAFTAFQSGGTLPQAWEIAFNAVKHDRCTMLQHLLLGMNAHVFLDLGVAAAETMKMNVFSKLKHDFAVKNDLLFNELEPQNNGFGRFARYVALFDYGLCSTDVWLLRQGRTWFRESNWDFGKKLSELDPAYWAVAISDRDSLVSELAWRIVSPGFRYSVPLVLSKLIEGRSVARNITQLDNATVNDT
jgi:hypothetical protein